MGSACRKPEPGPNPNHVDPAPAPKANSPADYKVLIIGDPAVGKTSLLLRFVKGTFSGDTQNSVGADEYLSKKIDVDGVPTTLNIWDTAGQEKFRTITSSYYRGAHGVIIVFDVSRPDTFTHVGKWHEQISRYSSENVPVVLVGNKIDLTSTCNAESIKELCENKNIQYLEASASSGHNVDSVFMTLSKLLQHSNEEE